MGKFKKRAAIYLIFNVLSKKAYVGYTEILGKRWANHRNRLRANKHKNLHLQSAWNMYGEGAFIFSVLEDLPSHLSKKEYEEIETKWVLFYESHKSEFGYNSVLPGSIPLDRVNGMNAPKVKKERVLINRPCICINKKDGTITERVNYKEVSELTGIPFRKVTDYCNFWNTLKGRRKCYKGWLVVKKDKYNPKFDYMGYGIKIKSENPCILN